MRFLRDIANDLPDFAVSQPKAHSVKAMEEGYAVVELVEVLRYKPEVRGFDSRGNNWNLSLT